MPHPARRKVANQVLIQLIEAEPGGGGVEDALPGLRGIQPTGHQQGEHTGDVGGGE